MDLVTDVPTAQTEIDVFRGQWTYDLPIPGTRSGAARQFHEKHGAVWLAERCFGSLRGMRCLELGPNEGEVSFHLYHAGAARVIAVEARRDSYLKCLIVKNLLDLDSVKYMLGDFERHLEATENAYDICFACGVLYHMSDPVRTLELIAAKCKRLAVATHYFAPRLLGMRAGSDGTALPEVCWSFPQPDGEPVTRAGLNVRYYRNEYAVDPVAHEKEGQGGIYLHSNLMTLEDLLRIVRHLGMEVVGKVIDAPDWPRGPHVFFCAERRS